MRSLVLIADNDRTVNGLLRDVLVQRGLQVRQCFDGRAAMQEGRAADVGVLVCDLDMPGASGIEVLESLADLAAPPPAVVVSGYLDAATRARLQALPFVQAVLGKPFDLLAFADRVARLVAPATDSAGA
ncbi:MAG: response regulator [Planctomycetes bacterium]|nr:response regulator [Planctomycetota bacterium]